MCSGAKHKNTIDVLLSIGERNRTIVGSRGSAEIFDIRMIELVKYCAMEKNKKIRESLKYIQQCQSAVPN